MGMRTFEDVLQSAKNVLGAAYLLVMPLVFLWAIAQPVIFAYQTLVSRTVSAFSKKPVIRALNFLRVARVTTQLIQA